MIKVDLNADLGEHPGTSLDAEIISYLSSCNIACGGHIGDKHSVKETMLIACGGHIGDKHSVKETMLLAQRHDVKVGAHPSFPDKTNFGRKVMELDSTELESTISTQIMLVKSVADELGVRLNHVKPHGALYNLAATDKITSKVIGKVIRSIDPDLKWVGLAHSVSEKVARELGVLFVSEAFADRKYEGDRTLRSRSYSDAVIVDEKMILRQVEELVFRKRVYAADWVSVKAETICLHGDTEGAVNLARRINEYLTSKGVNIYPV